MTTSKTRNIITKIHFSLLGTALLNFLLKNTLETSLNFWLAYIMTLLIYASGIVLFVWNLKPFNRLTIYFCIYIVTPILTLLFWLFGGIFFGLLASIVLYPIYPSEVKAESKQNVIYADFHGFLSGCCPYGVTEKRFLLLERKIAEIDLGETIDFKNVSMDSRKGKTELKIQYDRYDYKSDKTIAVDTIILLRTD